MADITPESFVRSLRGAPARYQAELRSQAVALAGIGAQAILQGAMAGKTYRFTGRGDGKKFDLTVKGTVITGTGGGVLLRWAGSPPGPWVLFQRGSHKKPTGWEIKPFRFGKRALKARDKRGLSTVFSTDEKGGRQVLGPLSDGTFRQVVHHPYQPGVQLFTRGVIAAAPVIDGAIKRVVTNAGTAALTGARRFAA